MIDKTNWAQRFDQPPYEAYAVTTSGQPIPGLYAAGEIAGGLFFHN